MIKKTINSINDYDNNKVTTLHMLLSLCGHKGCRNIYTQLTWLLFRVKWENAWHDETFPSPCIPVFSRCVLPIAISVWPFFEGGIAGVCNYLL